MNLRPFCFCVCSFLLASLWTGEATPAAADPLLASDEVELATSSSPVSTIPIDIEGAAWLSCGSGEDPRGPKVRCSIITNSVLSLKIPYGDVGASVVDLHFVAAEAVVTSCGTWDVTLTLDPTVAQPESPMVFEEAPPGSDYGMFGGVLEMDSLLHLANRDTGQTAEYRLRLGLGREDPWLAPPTESAAAVDPSTSAEGQSDCVPLSILGSPDDLKIFLAEGCSICGKTIPAPAPPR